MSCVQGSALSNTNTACINVPLLDYSVTAKRNITVTRCFGHLLPPNTDSIAAHHFVTLNAGLSQKNNNPSTFFVLYGQRLN